MSEPTIARNTTRLPLTIRLIGIGLILLGILSIADLAKVFVVNLSVSFDLGDFNLLIGIGILLRSNIARKFAAFEFGAVAVVFTMALFVALMLKIIYESGGASILPPDLDITLFTIASWRDASMLRFLFDVVLGAAFVVFLMFLLNELTLRETVELFSATDTVNPTRGRFQVRISTMLLWVVFASLILVQLRSDGVAYRRSVVTQSVTFPPSGRANISYGIREHRWNESPPTLEFVVINRSKGATNFSSALNKADSVTTLYGPNGEKIVLPTDTQFVQIDDDGLHTFEGTVTFRQLKAYLDSKPTDPNIVDLLATTEPEE